MGLFLNTLSSYSAVLIILNQRNKPFRLSFTIQVYHYVLSNQRMFLLI